MDFWKNTVISDEKDEKKQKFSWKILFFGQVEYCNFMKDGFF
jgi:hypothetical protein